MHTRSLVHSAFALAALACLAAPNAAHAQLNFVFSFDNTFDTTLTPPLVGAGSLSLATDPGDGTFNYTTLAPTYAFTFGAVTFTQANIVSNPSLVRLVISTSGNVRRLQFSDTGSGSGGLLGGSLDLVQGSNTITFEPTYFGQGLNLYQTVVGSTTYLGTYRGLITPAAVPEPGSVALLAGIFVTGAGFIRKRHSRS